MLSFLRNQSIFDPTSFVHPCLSLVRSLIHSIPFTQNVFASIVGANCNQSPDTWCSIIYCRLRLVVFIWYRYDFHSGTRSFQFNFRLCIRLHDTSTEYYTNRDIRSHRYENLYRYHVSKRDMTVNSFHTKLSFNHLFPE